LIGPGTAATNMRDRTLSDASILQGERARKALAHGGRTMTALLRPTLGPLARTVAVAGVVDGEPPEILDDGATIARRTVQLDDPFADMGGMLLRHLAWNVHETAGGGATTACLVVQGLVDGAAPYVAAGGDPLLIKRTWQRLLDAALDELRRQMVAIDAIRDLQAIARGSLREPELVEMVAEVMEAVGPDGSVSIEDSATSDSGFHFLEATTWQEGWASFGVAAQSGTRIDLEDPAIFLSELPLLTGEELLPGLNACREAGSRNLVVLAPQFGDGALTLLLLNRERGNFETVAAARSPLLGRQQTEAMADLAALTGGRSVNRASWSAGDRVRAEDLGHARQVWMTRREFCIIEGAGDRTRIRERLSAARAMLRAAGDSDKTEIEAIRARIGRLGGVSAVVRIGAATKAARAERKGRVETAVNSLRAALRGGAVPGAGAALVRCAGALELLDLPDEERPARRIFARALGEPMRAIAENAGLDASMILADALVAPPGRTFDVVRRRWVDAVDGGILDPLETTEVALERSVSMAGMMLTTETLVRRPRPPIADVP
jgi:chaperonin GroEL